MGVLLHHVAGVMSCLAAAQSQCWLGLNISLAFTFEIGSFAVLLSDLGLAPKAPSYWMIIGSSALPLLWIAHGFCSSPPSGIGAMFCVVGAIIGGSLRINEAVSCLSKLH